MLNCAEKLYQGFSDFVRESLQSKEIFKTSQVQLRKGAFAKPKLTLVLSPGKKFRLTDQKKWKSKAEEV